MRNEYFKPQTLVAGNIKPEDIQITISESTLTLPKEIECRIEELWEQKMQEAKERNLNWFNGTSYRIQSWKFEKDILQLDLALIDFKHRSGLIVMSRNNEIDSEEIVHGGCFVGSTVRTKDGHYVMVRMTGKSALNINSQDVLGGMAETDVPCADGSYLYDVLYQELEEEGCIEKEAIASCALQMMYRGMHGHYGFYFETELHLTKNQLLEKFKGNADVDIESLVFYSRKEYLDVLKKHSPNKKLIASVLEI